MAVQVGGMLTPGLPDLWDNLTRRIDGSNIGISVDPKEWTGDERPRICVPIGAPEQLAYYTQVSYSVGSRLATPKATNSAASSSSLPALRTSNHHQCL